MPECMRLVSVPGEAWPEPLVVALAVAGGVASAVDEVLWVELAVLKEVHILVLV